MPERSKDWLNQAQRDLDSAAVMMQNGIFEWTCFVSQQAAEKAVKAVLQKMNAAAWGHSVFDLLRILAKRVSVSDELLDCARALDKYYIPTRYPNGFESGSPYEYFTRRDAEDAVFCGRRIFEFCEGLLARPR
ncbi:MAG: HEPN domain-containing protein [Firmicutes bacterium]|nr:HEPN domain-containing protein [Bacillota bacterium]